MQKTFSDIAWEMLEKLTRRKTFLFKMNDDLDAPVGLVSTLEAPMPYSKSLEAVLLPTKQRLIDEVKKVLR